MNTPNTPDFSTENAELRARLEEAEETLRAIRSGEVDALVMAGEVYTLKGAETPYRLLIESMNEGAATLAPDGTILYCNRRFADMVATPAEQVIGSHLERWVAPAYQPIVRALVTTAEHAGARAELAFSVPSGPDLSVMLSLRPIQMDSHTIGVVAADLSERKRAEEELRRANESLEERVAARTEELRRQREWLSVTLRSIGDALIAIDAASRVTFLNPVAEALTGWSRQEALGQPVQSIFQIVDETTRIPGEDIIGRVLREGTVIKLANNTCLITRDGREIPIEDSAAPIRDSDGQVAGAVLVFHDVTEKRRAQHALRESEQRFRSVLDNSMDCIYRVNLRIGQYEYISPSAEKIVGFSPEELMRQDVKTALAMIHPADLPVVQAALARFEEAGFGEAEYRQRAKSGGYRWLSNHMSLTRDGAGQPLYRNGTIRDITERKRTEQEVRSLLAAVQREKETLSSVLNSISDEVWFADTNKQFTLTNPAALREFALDSAQGIGVEQFAANLEVLRPDGSPRPVEEAPLLRALQGEAGRDLEEIIRTPGSGELRYRQVTAAPVRNAQGAIIGSVAVVRDITERKQAQRDLFNANQRLEALMRAVPVGVSFSDDPTCQRVSGNPAVLAQFEVAAADNLSASAPDTAAPGRQLRFFREGRPITDAELPLQRAVAENKVIPPMELEVHLPSGRRWFAEASGAPVHGPQGEVVGGLAVTVDITVRKQAEEALARQREELQLILDSAPALIFYKDRENHFLRINRAFADSMGRTKEQLEGKSLFDLYPREQAEAYWRDDQEVLASGQPKLNIVEPMRTAAGERWVQTGKVPCRDTQGNLTGVIGFALDITERRHAEVALRESEERYRLLFDRNPDGVFAVDTTGRFVVANPACEVISGYSTAELRQKTFMEICAPDQIARTVESFERGLRESKSLELETALLRKDGRRIEIWVAAEPLTVDQKTVVHCTVKDITDRKRVEEALRQSEALAVREKEFRLLAEAMPQIVWATRADGWNTYFNQQWVDYTGLTQEESYGHGWNKPLHPDDQKRAWDTWQNAITNRATYALECRLRRADGIYRWWLVRGVPVLDEKGTILKWYGTCTDINDLKQAEEALREAGEERLRLVLEATSMGTFEVDLRTGEGRWNTVEFELLGLKPGDAPSVPATFFRYLHPDDAARVQAQWAEATQTGILNTEFRIVRADGEVRWLAGLGRFAYAGTPDNSAPEGKREPVRFLGVNFDITERKQMEAALRESESRYRAIGESIDYGVWVCAPNGRNLYASPSFLKLVGLTQEQCSNFGWGDVLYPDDTARTIAAWKECVRTEGKWDIEHRFRGVDGKYHPVLARGVPVRNDQGEVACWVGINLDISRLKEAEEEVRRRAEELRATNDELTRFNEAMVGRELRMIELKQEIDALCAQFGQPPRYGPISGEEAQPAQ
jgi:PAS domain S-box-containing protein